MAIDGDRIYPTISLSGAEDPSRTGYVREGDEWVETWPMTTARKAHGRRHNVYGGVGIDQLVLQRVDKVVDWGRFG